MTALSVIVTGGRTYGMLPADFGTLDPEEQVLLTKKRDVECDRLYGTLDALQVACLAQGGAKGADLLARSWARSRGIWLVTYDADWNRYGRSAGPIRNERMLSDFEPDLVVAFPGGKGTAHMVSIALQAGVRVMMVGAA